MEQHNMSQDGQLVTRLLASLYCSRSQKVYCYHHLNRYLMIFTIPEVVLCRFLSPNGQLEGTLRNTSPMLDFNCIIKEN